MSSKGKKKKTVPDDVKKQPFLLEDIVSDPPEEGEEDEGEIRCICGIQDDDGFTIQCEKCLVWQHAVCVNITSSTVPDQYYCELCDPRWLDAERAVEIQTKRLKESRRTKRKEEKTSPKKRRETDSQSQGKSSESSQKRKQRNNATDQSRTPGSNLTPPRKKVKTATGDDSTGRDSESGLRQSSILSSSRRDRDDNSHFISPENRYESESQLTHPQQRNHARIPSTEPFVRRRKKTWNRDRNDPLPLFEREYAVFLHDFAVLRHSKFANHHVRSIVSKFYDHNHRKIVHSLPILEMEQDLPDANMQIDVTTTPDGDDMDDIAEKEQPNKAGSDLLILPLSCFTMAIPKVISQPISHPAFMSGSKSLGLFSVTSISKGDLISEIKGVVSLLPDLDSKSSLLSCLPVSMDPATHVKEPSVNRQLLPPFVFAHPTPIATDTQDEDAEPVRLYLDAREYSDYDARFVRSFCGNPKYHNQNVCNATFKTVLCVLTSTTSSATEQDIPVPLLPPHHQIRLCLFATRDVNQMEEIVLPIDTKGLFLMFPCVCGEDLEGCLVNDCIQSFENFQAWNADRDEESMEDDMLIEGVDEVLAGRFRLREDDRRVAVEKKLSVLEEVRQASVAARTAKIVEVPVIKVEELPQESHVQAEDDSTMNVDLEGSNQSDLEKDAEKVSETELKVFENPMLSRLKTPPPHGIQANPESPESKVPPFVRKVSLRDFMMQRGINAGAGTTNQSSGILNSPLGRSVVSLADGKEDTDPVEESQPLSAASIDASITEPTKAIESSETEEARSPVIDATNESNQSASSSSTGLQSTAVSSTKTSFLDRYKSLVENRELELEPEPRVTEKPAAELEVISTPEKPIVASPQAEDQSLVPVDISVIASRAHTPVFNSAISLSTDTNLRLHAGRVGLSQVEDTSPLPADSSRTHTPVPPQAILLPPDTSLRASASRFGLEQTPYGNAYPPVRSRESSVRSDYSDLNNPDRRPDFDERSRLTPPSGDRERTFDSMYSSSARRPQRMSLEGTENKPMEEKDYRPRMSWPDRSGALRPGPPTRGEEYDFDRPGPPRSMYPRENRDYDPNASRHRGYRPLFDAYPSSATKRYREFGPPHREWDNPNDELERGPSNDRDYDRTRRISDSRDDRPGREPSMHIASRSRSPSPSTSGLPPRSDRDRERDRGDYYRGRFDGPSWEREGRGGPPPRGRYPYRGGPPFRGGYRGRGRGRGGGPPPDRDWDRDDRR